MAAFADSCEEAEPQAMNYLEVQMLLPKLAFQLQMLAHKKKANKELDEHIQHRQSRLRSMDVEVEQLFDQFEDGIEKLHQIQRQMNKHMDAIGQDPNDPLTIVKSTIDRLQQLVQQTNVFMADLPCTPKAPTGPACDLATAPDGPGPNAPDMDHIDAMKAKMGANLCRLKELSMPLGRSEVGPGEIEQKSEREKWPEWDCLYEM